MLVQFLPRLRSAGIIVVFPSAPVRAYTLKGGAPSAVWFDRQALALDAPEDSQGIAQTELLIRQLVRTCSGREGVKVELPQIICQVFSVPPCTHRLLSSSLGPPNVKTFTIFLSMIKYASLYSHAGARPPGRAQ
jgi:hypothetical protein